MKTSEKLNTYGEILSKTEMVGQDTLNINDVKPLEGKGLVHMEQMVPHHVLKGCAENLDKPLNVYWDLSN